ncbi:SMP-30/gluconolactonase/LRE family protein [Rhodococcus spelaei]|uniref:SMP-30/gluconolactonase/LRE family protein n=1 Tax=Rhodococcus spelaei TaxID=2546320 RepID=UPI001FECE9D7|nr:SMP-30/gluconolactonase/LRE family protein [Rhodococcus spelaei]
MTFPEGVRWHDGALWFSDMHDHRLMRLVPGSEPETIATVPGRPSGIGFLPDGTPLVVSQQDRKVLRVEANGTVEHANLSGLAEWHCNDMFVDGQGRAYVGNYGDDSAPPDAPHPTVLILIEPDGSTRAVASDLWFPNGITVTPDGNTLIVAETRSVPGRLTAFDVGADGDLTGRRVLAEFEGGFPDGLAVDAEGAVWVAFPFGDELVRITPDGVVDTRLSFPSPYAVALGGPSGRELFVATAPNWEPEEAARLRAGAIHRLEVEAPAPAP